MNKNKFSVVISHIQNDLYAVVLKSWSIDNDGNKVDVASFNKAGVDIDTAHNLAINFVDKHNELKEDEDGK